ncbi:MAG: GTP cyclohydrolase I FolE2 [Candidatus Stahlbacteria bacterium]|nr:GTP cyclohydrolase I FolE2 [Candidatus Stahlbacteria bacterium]
MRDPAIEKPLNELEIDKVGIKNLKYPIKVFDKKEAEQHTVASINMYVALPHKFRGTHMSRFIEVLNKHKDTVAMKNMRFVLLDIIEKFDAYSAHIELQFPYFIEKEAPVSHAHSLMEYECKFICSLSQERKFEFILGVSVPIATLCPCSKALVDKGAHNQRGKISVLIKFQGFFWIEDIVNIVENCASTPLYSLLKREDEQFITQYAYDHPAFVEDVARNVASKLDKEKVISWYAVEVESYESIHNHDAYAFIGKK